VSGESSPMADSTVPMKGNGASMSAAIRALSKCMKNPIAMNKSARAAATK